MVNQIFECGLFVLLDFPDSSPGAGKLVMSVRLIKWNLWSVFIYIDIKIDFDIDFDIKTEIDDVDFVDIACFVAPNREIILINLKLRN